MHIGMTTVNLDLSRSDAAYVSGEKLKGQVRVNVSGRTKISAVYIVIKGKGRIIAGQEVIAKTFVDDFMELWRPAEDTQEQENLVLPFEYQLDPSLPSSLRCKHANIRYFIEAIVDRMWETDCRDRKEIVVMRPSCDLSKSSVGKMPINKQSVDSGSNKKPFEIAMYLPSHSLVARKKIPLTVKIGKETSKGMTKTKLRVKQIVRVKVGNHEKTYEKNVFKEKSGKLGNNNEIEWDEKAMVMPAVPSTGECWSYVQVSYDIKFIAYYGLNGPTLKISCPVIVGTSMTLPSGKIYSSVTPKEDEKFRSEEAILLNTRVIAVPISYMETEKERDSFFRRKISTTSDQSEDDDDIADFQSLSGSLGSIAGQRSETTAMPSRANPNLAAVAPATSRTGNADSPTPGRMTRDAPSPAPRTAGMNHYRGVSPYYEENQAPPPLYPPSYEESLEQKSSRGHQVRQLVSSSSNNLSWDASVNVSKGSTRKNIQPTFGDTSVPAPYYGQSNMDRNRSPMVRRAHSFLKRADQQERGNQGFVAQMARDLCLLPDDEPSSSVPSRAELPRSDSQISHLIRETVFFD